MLLCRLRAAWRCSAPQGGTQPLRASSRTSCGTTGAKGTRLAELPALEPQSQTVILLSLETTRRMFDPLQNCCSSSALALCHALHSAQSYNSTAVLVPAAPLPSAPLSGSTAPGLGHFLPHIGGGGPGPCHGQPSNRLPSADARARPQASATGGQATASLLQPYACSCKCCCLSWFRAGRRERLADADESAACRKAISRRRS